MASLLFPDTGSRRVERNDGKPAVNADAYLYADDDLSVPAEAYTDVNGVKGALLPVDDDGRRYMRLDAYGRITDFWGPADGTHRLWVVVGGVSSIVDADYGPRIDAVSGGTTGALLKANNLGDLDNLDDARTNLELGNAALRNVGATSGTVAAGDDSRISGAAQKAANLGDLNDAPTGRANLGLGDAAVRNVGTTSGDVAAGNAPAAAQAAALAAVASHEADTTSVHGIPDTAVLETQAGAQSKATAAQAAAVSTASTDATAKADAAQAAAIAASVQRASNLSDLASASTARTNLGLGDAATKNVGTASTNVAAGDAPATAQAAAISTAATDATTKANAAQAAAIAASAQRSANLSDLANAGTARTNLGLGSVDNTSDAGKPVSTATATALAGRVAKGELTLNLADAAYGGVGDGTTPNAAAFTAFFSALSSTKGKGYIPPGTYMVESGITWPSNALIEGGGPDVTIIKATSGFAATTFITGSSRTNLHVRDLTIDLGSGSTIVNGVFAQSLTSSRFEKVRFVNGSNAVAGQLWLQAVTDVDVVDCEFSSSKRGLIVNSNAAAGVSRRVKILRNKLHDLSQYGIYILGDATSQADDVWIDDNQLWNIIGDSPRYPIYTTCPTGQYHKNFRIRGNRITGNGTSFTTGTGTADQIAPYHLQDSVISGNISTLGGDGGIAVGNSRRLTIANNICYDNNTHGINVETCTDFVITGNQCFTNGHNWDGVTNVSAAPRSGIRLVDTTGCVISGNRCFEPSGSTPVQQYGLTVYDAVSVANTLGSNHFAGNTAGQVWYAPAVAATSRLLRDGLPTVSLASAASTALTLPAAADGATYLVNLTSGSCALTLPASPTAGQSFTVLFYQGTGGRVVTYVTTVKWPIDTPPTLATAASAVDEVNFRYDGTAWRGAHVGGYTA